MNDTKIREFNVLEFNNYLDNEHIDIIIDKLSSDEKYKQSELIFKLYCIKSNYEKMKELINQNIFTNSTFTHILERLCYYNNLESIKFLLNNIKLNTDEINDIFRYSSYYYNNESITYLFSLINLNTIDKNMLIINLCNSGNLILLKILISLDKFENNKNEYLYYAIKSNNIELVKFLLSIYKNDNKNDLFFNSCLFGNLEIMELFYNEDVRLQNIIDRLINEWHDNRIPIKNNVINYLTNKSSN